MRDHGSSQNLLHRIVSKLKSLKMKPQPASKEKSPSLSFLQTEHRMKPDPDMAAIGCKEHGLNAGGIHPLISSLKSRFRLPGLDKVEEYLVLMEGQMKQLNQEKEDLEAKSKKTMDDLSEEIQKYKSENDYLERKHADAVVEKLRLEEALKDSKRQMEDLEEKANRLIEEKRVMKEEQSIMSEREKRCEERLRKVMEEIKKSEEYNSQLSSKNRELESEKRRSEDVADKYRKKYLALDSRLLDVERDVEVLQKHRPNVYHRMDGDSGLRTAATPSSEKEAANKRVKQMSSVEILASPGVGSSFHTPTQRIIGFHSEGSGRHEPEIAIEISDSDDEIPKITRGASTNRLSNGTSGGTQPASQRMKSVSLFSGTGAEDTDKRKQEILGWLGSVESSDSESDSDVGFPLI